MMNDSHTNKILIVDDSLQNLEALESMLEGIYEVFLAKNGTSALRIAEKVLPDLILLDVVMPDIDGFEVLTRLKNNPALSSIPVIFVTSDTASISEARGLLLGAVDYIAKPYNPDIVSIKVKNQLENKLYRDSLEYLVAKRTQELVDSQSAIIVGMSLLAEGRDLSTGMHLVNMQKLVDLLCSEFHKLYPDILSKEEWASTTTLSPMHDIGKVMIPDSILLKPSPLTPEEFEIMKTHTSYGAETLRRTQNLLAGNVDVLEKAALIAEFHHEKFDGTGYPRGLKGTEIPLCARFVAIADVYDALTSDRVYKPSSSHNEAVEIILEGDGRTCPSHFDPMILDVFKEIAHKFSPQITL